MQGKLKRNLQQTEKLIEIKNLIDELEDKDEIFQKIELKDKR